MICINTAEFIEYYTEKNKISKVEAKQRIEQYEDTFKSAVAEYGKLNIRGFLTAEVVDRAARECRNPRNQKKIKTTAKRVVRLKISPKFKMMLEE